MAPQRHTEETFMQIEDHGFIVTGSSSGLGSATARRLIMAGARVLLADLDAAAGEALATELGTRARFSRCDVTDASSVAQAVSNFRNAFGALHGLVNCAGVAPSEKVLGREGPHRLEAFEQTVKVNLIGTFNMVRLAAAAMAESEPDADGQRGVIINTASVAAFEGQIGQAAYAASKGGVVAMTLPIARELARHGIRVVAIAPGIMETPMIKAMATEVQESLARMVPFPPRLGQPDEFARLVAHIIDNTYLNAEVIRLDGAIRMAAK
jgi:NAD(P)-dependent dehydrogenase (short-subunit alcohol dehydrogenase family)